MIQLLIGTYTEKDMDRGIYTLRFDEISGSFSSPVIAAAIENPSYLFMSDKGILYVASEPLDGQNGFLTSYRINDSAGGKIVQNENYMRLSMINRVVAETDGFVHLNMDKDQNQLYTVSYQDATLQVYAIREDGGIGNRIYIGKHQGEGVDSVRQECAHAHSVWLTPDEKYACICDLGLDKLFVYTLTNKGNISKENKYVKFPDGTGPRHMVFSNHKAYAYVIGELSNELFCMSYQEGFFEITAKYKLIKGKTQNAAGAAVRISPDEKFVYCSVRGEDTLIVYEVIENGKLSKIQKIASGGLHPRDFCFSHDGRYVFCVNKDSDKITAFFRDSRNGKLKKIAQADNLLKPICVVCC